MTDIKKMKSLLEKLSNAHGISGYEGGVREVIKKEVESCVDELKTDNLGNLIATRKGKSPSVMIAAHMDEIGLMAKYIDDEGFVRFAKVGGGSTRRWSTSGYCCIPRRVRLPALSAPSRCT